MALGEALDRLLERGLQVLVEARVLDRRGGARADDAEQLALALVEALALGEATRPQIQPSRRCCMRSGTAMSD